MMNSEVKSFPSNHPVDLKVLQPHSLYNFHVFLLLKIIISLSLSFLVLVLFQLSTF